MSTRLWFASLILAVGTIVPVQHASLSPVARAAGQGAGTTTLDDQSELAVTVYNSDIARIGLRLGLPVHQRRRLPKLYRQRDHNEITPRFWCRTTLQRRLLPDAQ
jgi:hypothetical protein